MLLQSPLEIVSRPDVIIVIFCTAKDIDIPKRHRKGIVLFCIAPNHSSAFGGFGYGALPVG